MRIRITIIKYETDIIYRNEVRQYLYNSDTVTMDRVYPMGVYIYPGIYTRLSNTKG